MANVELASERAVSFEFLKEFVQSVPKEYTTVDVMTKIIVPATVSNKISYAKIIPVSKISKPSFFVSHRWGCKFWFIFELIEEYMRNNPHLDSQTTFFWIDIFAVNQHPGTEQQEDLKQLAQAIELSSKTLLCMDETGEVLTRIWCLYEIWKTLESKASASYLTILLSSLNEIQVQEIFLSFDVTKAQATVAEDRERIMNDIEASVGAQQMTRKIKESLCQSSEEEITALENAGASVGVLMKSLEKLAHLKRMEGKYTEYEQIATKALQLARASNDNAYLASSLLMMGYAHYFQSNMEAAEKAFEEALKIKKERTEEDLDFTRALEGLANSKNRLGKLEESENLLKTSLEIRKQIAPNSYFVAGSLNNLAMLYWHQEKYQLAQSFFTEAIESVEKCYHPGHFLTLSIEYSLGLTAAKEGKFPEAEKIHLEVLEARKKFYGQEHPEVADSLVALSQALLYQDGKQEDAINRIIEALEMRKRLLGPDHPTVKQNEADLAQLQTLLAAYYESLRDNSS